MARKPRLVLDLDHTLVYAHVDMVASTDFYLKDADGMHLRVMKRPGVDAFLESMAAVYELVVASAGMKSYVDTVVAELDPTGELISRSRVYSKEACLRDPADGNTLVKSLKEIGEKDVKRVVALDDVVEFYKFDRENVVRAEKFEGSEDDRFLERLTPFLVALAKLNDFREAIVAWKSGECQVSNGRILHKDPFDDEWICF